MGTQNCPLPIPSHIWDDICTKYRNLRRAELCNQSYVRRFKRLKYISSPKFRHRICKPPTQVDLKRNRNILREHNISTRLDQLSLPPVRKLLIAKKEFGKRRCLKAKFILNRQIRKSALSIYSRLANVRPPRPKEKVKKWTEEEWEYMNKKLRILAKPKTIPTPPKIKPKVLPLEKMVRLEVLSKPKEIKDLQKPEWVLTTAMKEYQASERLQEISEPFKRVDHHFRLPKVTRGALKYKITERIENLSKPLHNKSKKKESDEKENPFKVAENALKYRITKRTRELAEPRTFPKEPNLEDAFKVAKSALTYQIKPRIIKLAEPKNPREKYVSDK